MFNSVPSATRRRPLFRLRPGLGIHWHSGTINTHHSCHVTRGTDLIQYRLRHRVARSLSRSPPPLIWGATQRLPRCVSAPLASRRTWRPGGASRRPGLVVISRQDERWCDCMGCSCRTTVTATRSQPGRLDGIMARTQHTPGRRLQRTACTHFRFWGGRGPQAAQITERCLVLRCLAEAVSQYC